jgi:hypothetical protein
MVEVRVVVTYGDGMEGDTVEFLSIGDMVFLDPGDK